MQNEALLISRNQNEPPHQPQRLSQVNNQSKVLLNKEPYHEVQYEQMIKIAAHIRNLKRQRWIGQLKDFIKIPYCRLVSVILAILLVGIILIYTRIQCWFNPQCIPNKNVLINYYQRFPENRCVFNEYTVTTTALGVINQQKYLAIYCVDKVDNGQIQFISSFEKTSATSNISEKPVEFKTYMDKVLFESGENIQRQETQMRVGQDGTINDTIPQEFQGNDTQIYIPVFYHPIYRFSVMINGTRHPKLNWVSFPIQGDKLFEGLLQPFIDAFLPLVDASLYTLNSQTEQKKLAQHKRLLQEMDEKNGGVNANTSVYSFKLDQSGRTNLSSQHGQAISSDSQNSNTELIKDFSFDDDATLHSSKVSSKSTFESPILQKSPNYQTIQATNDTISINRVISLKLNEQRIVDRQRIQKVVNLSMDNQTLNKTFQQFNQYLITPKLNGQAIESSNQNQVDSGTRILQRNLQSSVITVRRQNNNQKMSTLNIFGINNIVETYTEVTAQINSDPDNPYKKNTTLKIDMGYGIKIGRNKFNVPLLNYMNNFSSLTLAFTRKVIVEYMNSLSPNFGKLTDQVFQDIVSGKVFNNYIQRVEELTNLTRQITEKIQKQIDQMDPQKIIQKIIDLALNASDLINTNVVDQILKVKKVIINDTITSIKQYSDKSLNSAEFEFNQFKSQLNSTQEQTKRFSDTLTNNYQQNKEQMNNSVQNLIKKQIQDRYNQEMKKAKPILDFISFVYKGIKKYQTVFLNNKKTHIENFQGSYQHIHQDFLNVSKKNHTEIYVQKLDNYSKTTNDQYRRLRVPFENFQEIIDQKITNSWVSIIQNESKPLKSMYDDLNVQFQIGVSKAGGVHEQQSGYCCEQDWKGTCIWRNPARFEMNQQPTVYANIRTFAQSSINTTYNNTLNYITQVQQIIDSNVSVKEKYMNYRIQEQMFIPINLQSARDELQKRIDRSWWYIDVLCRADSGPVYKYIDYLKLMITKITEFENRIKALRTKVDNFQSVFSYKDYLTLLDVIKVSTYITWLNDTINVAAFEGNQVFQNLYKYYQTYSIETFLFSNQTVIENYLSFYADMKKKIDFFCINSRKINDTISKASKDLKSKQSVLKNFNLTKQKEYFDLQISDFIPILTKDISHVFVEYESIPVCQYSNEAIHFLNTTSDVQMLQFSTIQKVYESSRYLYHKNTLQLESLSSTAETFKSQFYTLRSQNEYLNYIDKINNYTAQVKNLFKNTIQQTTRLKDLYAIRSLNLNYSQYVKDQQTLLTYIYQFNTTTFSVHYNQVFPEATIKKKQAIQAAKSLSYQIIELVITAKMMKQTIESNLIEVPNGIQNHLDLVTKNFGDLKKINVNITEKQLQILNSNLSNLIQVTNKTVFPFMQSDTPDLVTRFKECSIVNNQDYRTLYQQNYNIFVNNVDIFKKWKFQHYNRIQAKINQLKLNLNSLQIAGLSRLNALGKKIQTFFHQYELKVQDQLHKLENLQQLFLEDFQQLFQSDKIVKQISMNIQTYYKNTVVDINKEINTTFNNLDVGFKRSFKNTLTYYKLKNIGSQLQTDFEQVNIDVQNITLQMRGYLNSLSEQLRDKLLSLNHLRISLKNISEKINDKLQNINQTHEKLRETVENVKKFDFKSLIDEIKKLIDYIESLKNDFNLIIDQDFKSIEDIYQENLPKSLKFNMSDLWNIISMYEEVNEIRISTNTNLDFNIITIKVYEDSDIFYEIYSLKKGKLYIEGLITDFPDKEFTQLIDQKNFKIQKAPMIIVIPMVIATGIYNVEYKITFEMFANYIIQQYNYRNINCTLNSKATIKSEAAFKINNFPINNINLKIKGTLFDGNFTRNMKYLGISPIEIIPQIKQIENITSQNKLAMQGKLNFFISDTKMTRDLRVDSFRMYIEWMEIILFFIFFFFSFFISFFVIEAILFLTSPLLVVLTPIIAEGVAVGLIQSFDETDYHYYERSTQIFH